MSAIDDLAMPLDYLLDAHDLRRIAEQGRNEDVGVALQHDDVFRTRLHEHVTIETGQRTGADEIVQDPIAGKARVQHGDLRCVRARLEPRRKKIRKAPVRIQVSIRTHPSQSHPASRSPSPAGTPSLRRRS